MATARTQMRCLAILIAITGQHEAVASDSKFIHRDFLVEAAIFSYIPGKGIEAYQTHGSGMASDRASLGLGARINDTSLSANIVPRIRDERFVVTVDIEPENVKQSLKFQRKELDATELKPMAVRLGTDDEGRVYQLNIAPAVRVVDVTPQSLDVEKLRLHNWRFPDSPILVNDALYVGRLSCFQSPVAFIDISGVAKVEFSLFQLTGAKPWGVLSNGTVTLTNPDDETTIEISNVQNGGSHAVDLPGGPYQVWVRWSKPTLTVEQHREELSKIRERIRSGEIPDVSTTHLDKQLASAPVPWLYSGGVRGLHKGELVTKQK